MHTRTFAAAAALMSTVVLAAAPVAPLSAQTAPFEGVITMRVAGGRAAAQLQDVEYLAHAGKVRMNIASPMGSMGIIGVPAEKKMYMLMGQQRMYVEVPMNADAVPAGNAMVNAPEPKMTRTGKKETIAGYECEHVLVESEQQTADVCMARGLGPFLNAMSAMGSMGRGGGALPGWQRSLAADGAFPLKVTGSDGTVMLEVTKIEKKRLTNALFDVPADYTKMDMPRRP